jgi:hypothetical protein
MIQAPKFPYLFSLVLLLSIAALAQSAPGSLPQAPATGKIVGTVEDITGAVVPGASVTLQGPTAAETRTTVAGEIGSFTLDDIPSGIPFRVLISAPGLKDWSSPEIVLQSGQALTLNGIALAVAPVEFTVNAITVEEQAAAQVKAAEKQKVFGFVPNFYVSYDPQVVPLTAKLKFQLAFRTMIDPTIIGGIGLNAAFYQATDYPSYGQGGEAYAKRVGASFANSYTNILVGNAVLPSLLHQDPRYFYQGTGTKKSRLMHALGSAFVTRKDYGRQQINFSAIGGDLASGALANAYYPRRDRGVGLVFTSAATGAGWRMVYGVLQEFVLRKFTSHHDPQVP